MQKENTLKNRNKFILLSSLFLVSCSKPSDSGVVSIAPEPPKVVEEYQRDAQVITVGSNETGITVTIIDSYTKKIDDKAAGIICYSEYNGGMFCIKMKEASK